MKRIFFNCLDVVFWFSWGFGSCMSCFGLINADPMPVMLQEPFFSMSPGGQWIVATLIWFVCMMFVGICSYFLKKLLLACKVPSQKNNNCFNDDADPEADS